MAGTIQKIAANSITTITHLNRKPIYFLTIGNAPGPTFVVKGEPLSRNGANEEDTLISQKWSSKIMKNVNNPLVTAKIMDPTEIQEFKRAILATFNDPKSQPRLFMNDPNRWLKMPYLQGLETCDVSYSSDQFAIKKLKGMIAKFCTPEFWFDLGKILAADIFNGNNDRFCVSDINKKGEGEGQWVNHGNIMFFNGRLIGLDTWDPSGAHLESNLGSVGGFESLRILTNDNLRRIFATRVAESVGSTLQGFAKKGGIGSFKVLVNDKLRDIQTENLRTYFLADEFFRHLIWGLEKGSTDLKGYLLRKNLSRTENIKGTGGRSRNVTINHLSDGIRSRMQYLGWM